MEKHIEDGINVLSVFDGMRCAMIALDKVGVKVNNYFSSEIDKYANKVADDNYPDAIQLGDILNVDGYSLPTIDLLVGGSPCQGFSFSGKRLNFEDPRSKLFFEFVRLLEETKPKYFLLENVVMRQEEIDVISKYLGVKPEMINSARTSAQNRRRLYWTNIPNVTQPEDKGITWGDVREHGVNTSKFYYTPEALQWLGRASRRKIDKGVTKLLKVHADEDKMQMLEASHCKKYSNQRFFGIVDTPSDMEAVAAIRGRKVVGGDSPKGYTQFLEFRYDGKTNTLTTVSKDNVVVPFTLPNRVPAKDFFFRYITPLECERLQNVPDGYTSSVSDTQRYKMLGNGWTVDVVAHIFKGLDYAAK